MPGGIDQMLEFVRKRTGGNLSYEVHGSHVLVDRSSGIRHQQIEHLCDVARFACRRATDVRCREKIAAEKEPANERILVWTREPIDCTREKQNCPAISV